VPAGLAAAAGVPVTQAGTPAKVFVEAPIDPAVLALVADLGSDDYRVREKAGRGLEARGERSLPDLRRALAAAERPEVARRLAVMVRRMEHDRLVSPKRVTLAVKDKTARELFGEIARQTGYRIDVQPGNGRGEGRYSLAVEDAPFWVAMDKAGELTGLWPYPNGDDDGIQVNAYQDGRTPFVAYAGPFKLAAQQITSNKTVQLAGGGGPGNGSNRQPESLFLNFNIQSEPKNPILQVLQAELLSATDDTGASLVPPKDPNQGRHFHQSYYSPNYRGYMFSSNLNFVRGGRDATRITSLKGRIGVVLLAGTVPEVVVPEPLKVKAKKYTGRGVEVDFDGMTEANGAYTLTLTARKLGTDENGNTDYNWMNSAWQRIEVVDAAGVKYRGFQQGMNYNGTSVTMTMMFQPQDRQGKAQKLGPPARVVFNDWLQVTHEVPFEFKDLPLP
ncbi:MAG: hypothetical protein K2X82_24550, partial [Gemmataceae bacterium]|nr:hypothetical protein [Gemmataceae bacterium]